MWTRDVALRPTFSCFRLKECWGNHRDSVAGVDQEAPRCLGTVTSEGNTLASKPGGSPGAGPKARLLGP